MKNFFYTIFVSILLCFVSLNTYSQSNYVSLSYGGELLVAKDWHCNNQTLNLQFGYFYNAQNAVEIDYSHGFKKDFVTMNRLGLNWLHEFNSSYYIVPYFKCGAAFKMYDIEIDNVEDIKGMDFKLGVGLHCYLLEDRASINLGVDLSNMAYHYDDELRWYWDETRLIPHIGISVYF